jgi:uncharacterized protein (DUF488 family)
MAVIYTIGHSTRSIAEFISLLQENGINFLADVRQFPYSKRYPHFNGTSLRQSLSENKIGYEHFEDPGGRRKPLKNSVNTKWRTPSFQGYADYMETGQFKNAIEELLKRAEKYTVAIMCSEVLWWRCHRSMISDYLKSKGIEIVHILGPGKTEPHRFTAPAKIINGNLSYASNQLF